MVSSLITGAISLLLILISGYIVATGILLVAETTTDAQNDMSAISEYLQHTTISILDYHWEDSTLTVNISNNGSTSFPKSDSGFEVYLSDTSNVTTRYPLSTGMVVIQNDIVNKEFWDPSEILQLQISGLGSQPNWVKFVTSNGASASTVMN